MWFRTVASTNLSSSAITLAGTPSARSWRTPVRDRFSIDVADGGGMEARGNIVEHEYSIERAGTKVAQVSKSWFRMRDTYGIEIVEAEDDALILAVAVCIDQMAHEVQ
jgi:uncharacterized protein YxjI